MGTAPAPAASSVYVFCLNAIVQAAAARGVAAQPLLRDAGIAADLLRLAGERVSMDRYLRLYELAEARTGDPDLGLAVGRISYFMGMNLHLYMTTICRDLREYLNIIPSTIRLRGDQGQVLIRPENGFIRLEWHPLSPEVDSKRCLHDEMLLASATIVDSICALPVPVLAVEFSYRRPAECAALEAAFGAELRFQRPVSCVYFSRECLRYPLIDPGFELGREFKAGAQSLFAGSETSDAFLRDTRAAMRRALPGGNLTIDALAAMLGVSRRTLQRRLERRGCSFKSLLQGLREELSLRYLDDHRLAITEIALVLGYSDQASFSNAFRAWRNCSPSEYRNRSGP
jgi:AraC-like DNA-binding protein